MATAAPSSLASSVEKTNGSKLSRLLIDGGTTVLRKVFDRHHPPANLLAALNACYTILNNLLRRRILNRHQWDQLFPPGGAVPDSNAFDITLLFLLLTNICGLSPPPSGWHTKPPPGDTSCEANLARVKFYRNVLYGHVSTTGVDTPTFSVLWQEISVVLAALGLDQAEIDRLKAEKCGEEDYLEALHEWADSEEDIKSQLKNMCQSQSKTQQTVDMVRQNQMEDRETLQDSYSKLEEVLQTQNKTQQTVEEVKEAVDSLKQGRDKDKADEVLRSLAKSEFSGDIEYYFERFQEDTREWIFNKVRNWLDDRSSQNRVMVISANAGMGKSVIAAVICKRMQKAGRLSGSHFCQHNNVRYRNPQLMLQSLACHLSHALPEYKQALVEQLSRNLGGHLNNMGVEELFALLFKEPLSTVGDPRRNMLMVIDGLDESEYQGRNELLDVIVNQFCKLPSWIRFLVTTRPAVNISGKLQRLKPFELRSIDEKNLEDIRTLFRKKLQHVTKTENVDALVEKLVLKTEGLMLYAHFLILYIQEDASVLDQGIRDSSLPLGISSVYHSYFKRLESELMKELDIKEEHFLNLLSAMTASREPLPIDYVAKVLVPSRNSPLAKRKVLKTIGSVSSLLPIRDGCLHVIHKSVKDWLTDTSCYGEHEFIVDENEGHRVLADLCTGELDDLKRRGVHNAQFSATEKYALYHGARHMLHSDEQRTPCRLEELTKEFVIDLELVYAKVCVNNTTAAKDLLWLQQQGISKLLSKDSQSILDTLLFLLRKYSGRFSIHPRVFFQNMLNEGGTVLSAEASKLLRNKYIEIPYMEYVHKKTYKGHILARFRCSSRVACFDVSPELDYMVCECRDGMLQLWSLRTGSLIWERPVMVPKSYGDWKRGAYRTTPSWPVLSFYRSVSFHPTQSLVLPGILSHAYTIDGNLKPLFDVSDCKFLVCSISGDKTKMLTDCPDNAKCLVMWSLENGTEIARITRNEDILSFSWSRDGKLLAISHITGLICLVDVINGFRTLAEMGTPKVCGMLKFSPDHRVLFCTRFCGLHEKDYGHYLLNVNPKHHTLSLVVSSDDVSCDPREFKTFSGCGFLLGDPVPFPDSVQRDIYKLNFVLNHETELSGVPLSDEINMLNANKVNRKSQDTTTKVHVKKIVLSLDGQTVYVVTDAAVPTVMAWDVFSGELITEKIVESDTKSVVLSENQLGICLVPVRAGVIFTTTSSDTLEFWNFDMSVRLRKWTILPRATEQDHLFGTNSPRATEQDHLFGTNLPRATEQDHLFGTNLPRATEQDHLFGTNLPRATEQDHLFGTNLPRATEQDHLFGTNLPRATEQDHLFGTNLPRATKWDRLFRTNLPRATEQDHLFGTNLPRATKWDRLFRTNLPRATFETNLIRITEVIPVTEERVACVTEDRHFAVAVNIVDSTKESTIRIAAPSLWFRRRRVVTCNSKLQIVTYVGRELHLTDGASLVWKNDSLFSDPVWADSIGGVFSPTEQFVVVWSDMCYMQPAYVVDAVSGNTLHSLCRRSITCSRDVKFVSNEECFLSCSEQSVNHLRLFNVRTGHLLNVTDVENWVSCLGACPSKRLIVIGHRGSTSSFKVLRVWLPRDKTAGKTKGEL